MRSPGWWFWRTSAHICRWRSWLTSPRRSLVCLVRVTSGGLQWVLQMLAAALAPGIKPTFKPCSFTLHGLERHSVSGSPKWVFPGGAVRGWFQDSGPSCGLASSSGAMPSSVCIQWMKEGTQRHREGRRAIGQGITGTALQPHSLPGLSYGHI